MKKYTLAFLATLLVLIGTLSSQQAYASHAAGGEITYSWLRDSTYLVTFKFYRQCAATGPGTGTQASDALNQILCYWSDCGVPAVSVSFDSRTGPVIASVSCGGNQCTVTNSTIPGYEEYVYTKQLTLPSRCNSWHFSTSVGSRNTTQNLIPDQAVFYIESTLNNAYAQGNSSPIFSVKPVPFVCIGRSYNYNNGVFDVNNDSLSYEMVLPRQAVGNCGSDTLSLNYGTLLGQEYNVQTNPLPTQYTFNFNNRTGQIYFIPQGANVTTGSYGIAMKITEWRNGVKIGTIIRDIQVIYRTNCPNSPDPTFSTTPAGSSGVNFTSTRVEACVNKPLVLCVTGNSSDTLEHLMMESNNLLSAPGSSLAFTGAGTYNVKGCLSWTPTINDTGLKIITYTVTDTNCNTNGGVPRPQTYSVSLYINPVTTASPDVTICSGVSTPLHVIGGGNWVWSVLPGGSPVSSLSCTNCQNPIATPAVTTRYVVTALTSNSFCNINTDTVLVTVAPPATFSVGPDTTTCVNNSLQLRAVVSPTVGSNYSINWIPATYLNNPNIANPIVSPSADISYVIQLIPAGVAACATYDTLKVTVLQGYTFSNVDTQICKGMSVPIRFSGDARYTYTWSPAIGIPDIHIPNATITPDTTHTYVLTGSFPGCRDSVKSLLIDVQPVPTVYSGVDRLICYGDTVHIDESIVQPATYPNYTYSWSPAGAFNDPTRLHPIFTGYATTTTVLTVTTPAGCLGKDSTKYTVVPAHFLAVSADTAICPGDSAHLHVTGGYQSLVWSTRTYISDTLSTDPYVFPITTSTYTVTARDTNYCLDTASVLVEVRPGALISLPDSVTIFPGESYSLNPGGNGLYFTWFPQGGLSNPNIANPVATPSTNTRYFVTSTTEAGCSVRDSIDINVSLDSYIDVPNAFSPGSAPNALFKIVHRGSVTVNSFKVFNRWGALMFSTNNADEGWNGQFNGQPQPMGVYVYVVDASTPTGRHFYKQGNVTLIR